MTMLRVCSLPGALDGAARRALGDALTRAVLEVETGQDDPAARLGVMVQFDEQPEGHWYHGGVAVEDRYATDAVFWLHAWVMAGPWTPERKSDFIARTAAELRQVVRAERNPTIWFTMNEVPEGAWGVNGKVVGIEQLLWAFDDGRQATIRRFLAGREAGAES